MEKLRYGVVGVGGLGGYYGGKLAHAGRDVHFLYHSDFRQAKENGLAVDSIDGNFVVPRPNVYAQATEMPKCDVVFVCLKTTNNHLLPQILPPLMHADTHIVLVQNGLGIEDELQQSMPDARILGGLAFICSFKVGPSHIRHLDYGTLTLGAHSPNVDSRILETVAADLQAAGVQHKIAPDLNEARWRKLVWNIPYNGLTVILNSATDVLMKNAASRALIRDLMQETVAAGNACGAPIPESFAEEMLRATDAMKPYSPSMKLDFDNRRPLEIEAIYANPVKIARRHGFEMRKTAVLEQQLRFIVDGMKK